MAIVSTNLFLLDEALASEQRYSIPVKDGQVNIGLNRKLWLPTVIQILTFMQSLNKV